MPFLLDTHTIIWFLANDSKLPVKVKELIEETEEDCFVSMASLWEIGIKTSLNRLELHSDLPVLFDAIEQDGFSVLPIIPSNILSVAKLEFHHQDPFDRIIIAQAITNNLTILTKDRYFQNYPVKVIW